uniref:putative uncharacterized protein CXorf58 isoform X1 n=2 Tax=Styela clava TaxID=7725 RepID=UPI00193AD0FB|nr:putative uncharacterized protein CXorf58 isoform X1 [Styela clava]
MRNMEVGKTVPVYSSMGTGTSADIREQATDQELKKILAVSLIEKVYLTYRDRQMFTLLKHAICAAEQSWTHDFLRKISPLEAALLRDPSVKARVRLRFAGTEFPPIIVFKIFLVGDGTKYISGRKIIQPASSAASDACHLMGHRKFYDQMIVDACQYEKYKIIDEIDVTTMQDYMQYLSNMDETPSYLGGKENYWRQLTLEALPRQSIMYDIVEYLQTKSPSDRLRSELPTMMSRPVTQEVQLQHIRAISRLQTPLDLLSAQHHVITARSVTPSSQTQRRSVQARRRVSRMRKLYGLESAPSQTLDSVPQESSDQNDAFGVRGDSSQFKPSLAMEYADYADARLSEEEETALRQSILPSSGAVDRDVDDQEAKELFQWTQELNFEDVSRALNSSHSHAESQPRSTSWPARPIRTASGL